MFNWKRMFTDFGWAMAMTDPTCYSYYLASRLEKEHLTCVAQVALSSLRDGDRARPTVLRRTSEGSRQLI
jgi:hypothetical protein